MRPQALITGATGGIGRAIGERLAIDGFDLILVARTPSALDRIASEIAATVPGAAVEAQVCDVSKPEAVAALFGALETRRIALRVLVNGAGVSGGGITAEVSNQLWQNVIETNLNGAFYVTRDALRTNRVEQGGRIINIASTGGKQGVLHGAPYCASKHGMVGLTKALGLELARNGSGITVNAVCPGFVETEMAVRVRDHYAKLWGTDADETRRRVEERVPLGRYIEPTEVAAMVAYLVSSSAAGVTAQALNVCGGLGNY
jgi:ketoreductase